MIQVSIVANCAFVFKISLFLYSCYFAIDISPFFLFFLKQVEMRWKPKPEHFGTSSLVVKTENSSADSL